MPYNNNKLNRLSGFEELHKTNHICNNCGAALYYINNYMDMELGGTNLLFCQESESHIFEEVRRTGEILEFKKPEIRPVK